MSDNSRFRKTRKLLFIVGAIPVSAVVLLLMTLSAGIQSRILIAYRLAGRSMYPTIHIGDRIIVRKTSHAWTRGELVAYKPPQDPTRRYLHRVIGVSGDQIQLRENQLLVNDKTVERRLTKEPCRTGLTCTIWTEKLDGKSYQVALGSGTSPDFGPETVPDDYVFVLGDNRNDSNDSRYGGAVPNDFVMGVVEIIYWSSNDKDGVDWSRIGRLVH